MKSQRLTLFLFLKKLVFDWETNVNYIEHKDEILKKVRNLLKLHEKGLLGGEKMPEDSNPNLPKGIDESLFYFTLPMALNYQRNSYKLWEAALLTWQDSKTKDVFEPKKVLKMSDVELREKLSKYKVALQPNKQPQIWKTLYKTFEENFGGSVKKLFEKFNFDIKLIKGFVSSNKKQFPYLSGSKILNYWLYVMTQQSGFDFKNRQEITVAPDTHVLQASEKLGVVTSEELRKANIRELVSARWQEILQGTELMPIDIHTPFWLWSRNGFVLEL